MYKHRTLQGGCCIYVLPVHFANIGMAIQMFKCVIYDLPCSSVIQSITELIEKPCIFIVVYKSVSVVQSRQSLVS